MFAKFAEENRGLPRKIFWNFAANNPGLFYQILYRFHSVQFWIKLSICILAVTFVISSIIIEKELQEKLFKDLTEFTLTPELCLSDNYWWDDSNYIEISDSRKVQLKTLQSRKTLESFALNWLLFNLRANDKGCKISQFFILLVLKILMFFGTIELSTSALFFS